MYIETKKGSNLCIHQEETKLNNIFVQWSTITCISVLVHDLFSSEKKNFKEASIIWSNEKYMYRKV